MRTHFLFGSFASKLVCLLCANHPVYENLEKQNFFCWCYNAACQIWWWLDKIIRKRSEKNVKYWNIIQLSSELGLAQRIRQKWNHASMTFYRVVFCHIGGTRGLSGIHQNYCEGSWDCPNCPNCPNFMKSILPETWPDILTIVINT